MVIVIFLAAYEIPVTFGSIMSVLGSNQLANLLSFTPGGVGVNQAFNTFALDSYTDSTTATAYSISQQLITTAFNVVFALVLVCVVFGWSGGKLLVGSSYKDAKVKAAEMKASRKEGKGLDDIGEAPVRRRSRVARRAISTPARVSRRGAWYAGWRQGVGVCAPCARCPATPNRTGGLMKSLKALRPTSRLALLIGLVAMVAAGAVAFAADPQPAIKTTTPTSERQITNIDVLRQQIRNYYGDPLGTGDVRAGQQLRQGGRGRRLRRHALPRRPRPPGPREPRAGDGRDRARRRRHDARDLELRDRLELGVQPDHQRQLRQRRAVPAGAGDGRHGPAGRVRRATRSSSSPAGRPRRRARRSAT